jgi:hypothetical protein
MYPDQPLHDARAIYDMIRLRFDELQKSQDGVWSVLKITPASHSGSLTLIGAYIDAASGQLIDESTGNVVQPANRTVGITQKGSWQRIDALGHYSGANYGQYGWTDPVKATIRKREARDLYSPFAKGGNVFCTHNPAVQGAAQFESVHVIPRGWETSIGPAYESFKQSSQLFATPSLPSHDAELLEMLHGENSVVAVMAFRTLAENEKIDITSVKDALGQSEGYRQAAFVYLMLLQPGQIDESALFSELATGIDAASAPEGLRPMAIAIVAAGFLQPDLRMPQSLGPKVLSSVRDRSTRLRAGAAPDPYLQVVFEIMGVPLPNP